MAWHRGEHHTAGGDAGESKAVDVTSPEDQVEVAARDALPRRLAGDHDVTLLGRDVVMDLGAGVTLGEQAGPRGGGEHPVGGLDFRIARP